MYLESGFAIDKKPIDFQLMTDKAESLKTHH